MTVKITQLSQEIIIKEWIISCHVISFIPSGYPIIVEVHIINLCRKKIFCCCGIMELNLSNSLWFSVMTWVISTVNLLFIIVCSTCSIERILIILKTDLIICKSCIMFINTEFLFHKYDKMNFVYLETNFPIYKW